ncbi:MAG TPA: DUF4442 domain-containing protein [Bacteroidetes bacterium]|nr:DUF4442 domain-containing protein [Bacteroidota bacterium]
MGSSVSTKTEFNFQQENIDFIQKNFRSPFKFRMTLLSRLPMGFLSGMKVRELNQESCKVEVRYKWLNKNPFRSMFWAVLGMAAEMSSGALLIMYTYKQKPSIATLVTATSATYHKKAVGKITFVCNSGKEIAAAVAQTAISFEPVEVVCPMTGFNEAGEVVAKFSFTWSLKARKPKI